MRHILGWLLLTTFAITTAHATDWQRGIEHQRKADLGQR